MLTNPPIALELTEKRKINFDDAFGIQFLFSKNPNLTVGNFAHQVIGDWNLYYGDRLPFCALHDCNQNLIGLFLGVGVDGKGKLVDADFGQQFDLGDEDFSTSIEDEISEIAGRYIVILVNSKVNRIYFDPCATLSAVFDASTETIASSLMLCLDRDIVENPNFNNDEVLSGSSNYFFQHTRDEKIKLVLANHFLCLETFNLQRHWPHPNETFSSTKVDYPNIAADIIVRLSEVFGEITKNHESIVPLTGGVDSRIMVSSAVKHLKNVKLFFTFGHNYMSRLDVVTGKTLADRLKLPYKSYDILQDENRDYPKGFYKRQLLYRYWISSGYSFKTPREVQQDLLQYLPKGAVHLRANVVDLLKGTNVPRAFFAAKSGKEQRISEIGTLFRESTPSNEVIHKWMPEYMAWFNGIPENSRKVTHDLLYLEQSLPLSSQLFYGMGQTFYVYPYADRRFISNAFRFPIGYRKSRAAHRLVQEVALPSLSDIPFMGGHGSVKKTA